MLASVTQCLHKQPAAESDLWEAAYSSLRQPLFLPSSALTLLLLGATDHNSPLHHLCGNGHLLEKIWSIVRCSLAAGTRIEIACHFVKQWQQHGPVVFCLSLSPPDSPIWDHIAAVLTARGMRVIVPEIQQQDWQRGDWDQISTILRQLIRDTGSQHCAIIASSHAAQFAGVFAANGGEQGGHPTLNIEDSAVQRLVVIDPVGGWGDMHTVHPYIRCPIMVCWSAEGLLASSSQSLTVWRMASASSPGSSMHEGLNALEAPDNLVAFLLPPEPPSSQCSLM